jgi:hypothetical protein
MSQHVRKDRREEREVERSVRVRKAEFGSVNGAARIVCRVVNVCVLEPEVQKTGRDVLGAPIDPFGNDVEAV